ncbi:hypothetical protein ACFL1U_02245 [Patescibacteria group bacterium]
MPRAHIRERNSSILNLVFLIEYSLSRKNQTRVMATSLREQRSLLASEAFTTSQISIDPINRYR